MRGREPQDDSELLNFGGREAKHKGKKRYKVRGGEILD
jgi:hypothetical protein